METDIRIYSLLENLKLLTISTQNNMFIKFYNMNTIFYIKIFINADV